MSERPPDLRPDLVIELMGGDLSGLTVADLFADDGLFTFQLVQAGANVIAVVNDAAQAERIEARKRELGLDDHRLRVRAVSEGDPGLSHEEADMALMVRHFSLIQDRSSYFEQMRKGLKYPRRLVILEPKQGPSTMSENEVMDFIGTTGYSDVGAHSDKVPGHVLYLINDYFDPGEQGAY